VGTHESEHGVPQNQISPTGFFDLFFFLGVFHVKKFQGWVPLPPSFGICHRLQKKNLRPKAGKGSPMPDEVPIGDWKKIS